jgi:OPT oligopeptide transporter protein
MGMYLPISLTLVIPIGAILGVFYNKWADRSGGDVERKKRMGILLATGLIVGESLFGVLFAGIVAATGDDSPLAVVGDNFLQTSEYLGVILFVLVIAWLYKKTQQIANRPVEDEPADLTKS